MTGRWVAAGSALAAAGAAHAAVNAALLRTIRGPAPAVEGPVSILIPARNEAGTIAACVRSVLQQRNVPALEVLVLDDASTDGTASIVRSIADPRVRVLDGTPLPSGWLGKPHACAQLAAAARGRILAFLDADVELAPDAISSTVDTMRLAAIDLLCPYPLLMARTWSERLVQPLLPWSWLSFLPVRLAERSPRPSLCAVGGQFFAIDRSAYDRAGGHDAVRDSVLEDLDLGRAVKRSGGRVAIADGSAVARCRMYTGWRQVQEGYGKSLGSAFGSTGAAAAVLGTLGVAYVVPAVAAVRGSRVGLAGLAAGVAGRAVTARRTG
ncbi:MAG TPA: glycosyltransferase family A protein, partial [Mycobacteriales bacterium]|nr:glycosyltransferase family A protein [Mycobacteriales bacterium]